MWELIWNLRQDERIKETSSEIILAKDAIAETEERLERLALICQAMWSLLEEKTDLTEDDLVKRVTEIDLKDGRLDGKYEKPLVKCEECGATISQRFGKCLFCGKEYTDGTVFPQA